MNNLTWLMLEVMAEQRERELVAAEQRMLIEREAAEVPGPGLRRALAARLVRLGLSLDPEAREDLRGLELAPAGGKGGRTR